MRAVAAKLQSIIVLFLSYSFSITSVAQPTLRPESEQKLAHDIFQQFVEIPSGFTTGATTPVIDAAVARLKAAGFADQDIFVGGAIPSKANLVVRYRGTGARRPILLLAHVDVVEAKRSDWSMDPFHFVERDGYFYGRGTTDDKSQAAVWLATIIQLKQEGFKPDRDIILALTADEEGGGGNGSYNGVDWLLKHHKNLINAEFALNEGGFSEMIDGKKTSNGLQVSEKFVVNLRLTVRNKGGHSSLPVPDNAIYRLTDALQRLSQFSFPLQTNEVTAAYLKQLAKRGDVNSAVYAKAAANSKEAMQQLAAASPVFNAALRTTCVPTLLEAGHATNALPQQAVANINCRILPEDSEENVIKTLKSVIADDQVTIEVLGPSNKGPSSPLRKDVVSAMTELTQAFWPGVSTTPMMLMGATDGRFLRAAGIPTYGVSGFFGERDDVRAHGRDERLSVQSFYEGQAFSYELVKRLSS